MSENDDSSSEHSISDQEYEPNDNVEELDEYK